MTLQEVKQFLKENAEKDAEVKAYLAELSKVSPEQKEEVIREYKNSTDFKSEQDRFATKAINTFKEKTLPGIIEDQVKVKADELENKYNPPKNPAEEALRQQVEKLTKMQQESDNEFIQETLKTVKQTILSESGLPVTMADYIYVPIKDLTRKDVKDIEKLKTMIMPAVEPYVKHIESVKTGTASEMILRGTTKPGASNSATNSVKQWTKEDLVGKSPDEITKAKSEGSLDNLLGRQ